MRFRTALAIIVLCCLTACGSNDTAAGTTPTPTDLSGTWSGNLTLQGTPAVMTWTLTESGPTVTGPALVMLPNGIVLLNGSVSGTISGTTLTYRLDVAAGGIPSNPGCTGQLTGTTEVMMTSPMTLSGSYTLVNSTCASPLGSGSFTLRRQ